MGSSLSNLSTQSVVVVLVVVSAVSYTVLQRVLLPNTASTDGKSTAGTVTGAAGKKGKKGKAASSSVQSDTGIAARSTAGKPTVVPFPAVIPGGFDSQPITSGQEQDADTSTKAVKGKKKKGKKAGTPVAGGGTRPIPLDAQSESSATAPESHAPTTKPAKKKSPTPKPAPPSVSLIDTDDTWTRVEPRRRTGAQQSPATSHSRDTSGALGSDAGISTPVTGNSSPVAERTEDEVHLKPQDNRRTLAEKLLPKPRKTGVDDMLETPDYPTVARVMRVAPRPDERPAAGFSWADYEDVDDSRTADDADGEDEGGWVTKTTSKPRPKTGRSTSEPQQRAPEALTKKQRQNAAKREAQKSAKADAEAERLALLAKHKRELERTKMLEQATKSSKVSGGMSASMNDKGHLVWD